MYRIDEILTPDERMGAMRFGVISELVSRGIGPREFVRLSKEAQAQGGQMFGIDKLGILALMLGIPIGALSYALRSSLKPDTRKNRKLKASLDQFNDVVSQYRRQVEPKMRERSEDESDDESEGRDNGHELAANSYGGF